MKKLICVLLSISAILLVAGMITSCIQYEKLTKRIQELERENKICKEVNNYE